MVQTIVIICIIGKQQPMFPLDERLQNQEV